MFDEETASTARPRERFVWSLALHAAAVAVLAIQTVPHRPTPLAGPARTLAEAQPVRLVAPPRVLPPPVRRMRPMVPPPPSKAARFNLPAQPAAPTAPRRLISAPAPQRLSRAAKPPAPPLAGIELEIAGPRVRQAGFLSARTQAVPNTPATASIGAFGASSGAKRPPGDTVTTAAGFGGATLADAGPSGPRQAGASGFGTAQNTTPSAVAGAVRTNGFQAAERGRAPTRRQAPPSAASKALRILSKPRPVYTAAARERRIEGEVALRVRFLAAGAVEILEVISGLGYGLDEAAKAAAREIQFVPAQRNRRPVDVTATIRIIFQMAY